MKEKILVTGGLGYIGSHTVVELQQKGYDVLIIDNLHNTEKEVLYRIEKITGNLPLFYEIDLLDDTKLEEVFKGNKIMAIIHFAAYKAVGESVENPLSYYSNNLISLINLLKLCNDYRVNNFVFSSSCTVYGQPDILPVSENTIRKEYESPYGNTKKIGEDIINDYSKANKNFKASILRYFNPVGAHSSALIGEIPKGIPNNLVPFITQTAIGKRDVLRVFGGDYNTKDGSAVRDFIHVVDLAQAHIISLERILNDKNKKPIEVFNIGTGKGFTVLEVIKSFEKVSGRKLNYKVVDRRKGDIEKIWAETSFSEKELCWKAQKNLDDMMLSAWNWEKNIMNFK